MNTSTAQLGPLIIPHPSSSLDNHRDIPWKSKKNVKSAETEDRTQYLRLMRASLYRVSYFGTKINFKGSSGLRGSNTVPQDNLLLHPPLQKSLGFQLQSRALPSELSPGGLCDIEESDWSVI